MRVEREEEEEEGALSLLPHPVLYYERVPLSPAGGKEKEALLPPPSLCISQLTL